jgi:hypothetical protein
MSRAKTQQAAVLPIPPLLINEPADQFQRIYDALSGEIKAGGLFEQIYVRDIAYLTCEIERVRRFKSTMLNTAFSSAVEKLFTHLLQLGGYDYSDATHTAKDIAGRWFTNKRVREWGARRLRDFQLDESAIEAQAYKSSAENLEGLDRLEASLVSRRDKALRCIAEYRSSLARQLRESGDRIIEGDLVALEDASTTSPPIAG